MACSSREEMKYGYEDSRFEQNVDENFHCSICYNVLKDPMTCRKNEHLFCLECITQHLKVNSQTCPDCSENLSLDTLRRARVVNYYISKLKINCDYKSRGCPEFVCVEDLNMHVANCGFAPVLCSNEICGLEMNRHEREHHETVVCEYRKVSCRDCGETSRNLAELNVKVEATNTEVQKNCVEMKRIVGKLEENLLEVIHKEMETLTNRQAVIEQTQQKDVGEVKKEVNDMKKEVNDVKKEVNDVKKKVNDVKKDVKIEVKDVKENLSIVNKDVREIKLMITQLLEKFNNFELLNKSPFPTETILYNPREDILIAGGYGGCRSVEIYSWEKGAWFEISQMNDEHVEGSSFIHNYQLFVVGGYTKTIEFLDLKNFPLTWKKLPGELPYRCSGHQTVVCQQRVFYIGGYNLDKHEVSNAITELRLTSPFTMRELCKMTESRCYHGVEIVEDKVLIFGGRKSLGCGYLASVVEFDPKTNVCRDMPPLTQPLSGMATVSWRNQVVVLGGLDKHAQTSNDVFMYDCKTGKTTSLPSMSKKRFRCCAVITGDTIVVIGGDDKRGQRLNSVEHFTMGSSTWEYLPAMNKGRSCAVAEVLPSARKYV